MKAMRTIGSVLLVLLCMGAARVGAQATVRNDAPCGVLTADGLHVAATGHYTITRFANGAPAIVVCDAWVPPPGIRVTLDHSVTGTLCGCGRDVTTDWEEVIAPNGHATMICRLGPRS